MKLVLLILFSSTIILAQIYPHFTTNDYISIEQKSGKIAKNRAIDYQKKLRYIKKHTKEKQLNMINHYLNQLLPQYDDIIQKKEDYWSSPKEFLTMGYGDCEDYVIIKYFSLIKLGFDEKKIFITTVHEKYTGSYHMVLSYFKDKDKSPLVLDNLSFRVLDLNTREDIQADIFINSNGVYKMNENKKLYKIANKAQQYENLMKKVRENR